MLRYLAGVVSALLLVGAGVFLFRSSATSEPAPPSVPLALTPQVQEEAAADDVEELPAASAQTREQKRFGRADRNKDGIIAREEYLAPRRKAFARLDTNRDGRLSFEEWAVKTTEKFAGADRDRSGTLTPAEFATTAVKRTARPRPNCPPQPAQAGEE